MSLWQGLPQQTSMYNPGRKRRVPQSLHNLQTMCGSCRVQSVWQFTTENYDLHLHWWIYRKRRPALHKDRCALANCLFWLIYVVNSCRQFQVIPFNFVPVEPVLAGCSSDDECASVQACVSRNCVNPCITNNPCSTSAICTVSNHRATCQCPPGTTGDPYTSCSPSK